MYSYLVKVRGKTYAWGSSDLRVGLKLPLILVIHNDAIGDAVEVTSEKNTGSPMVLGHIQPAQCWTIPLEGLRGVSVTCPTDTTLSCSILVPQLAST